MITVIGDACPSLCCISDFYAHRFSFAFSVFLPFSSQISLSQPANITGSFLGLLDSCSLFSFHTFLVSVCLTNIGIRAQLTLGGHDIFARKICMEN